MPARKHAIPNPPPFEGTDINDVPEETLGFPTREVVDAEYAEMADEEEDANHPLGSGVLGSGRSGGGTGQVLAVDSREGLDPDESADVRDRDLGRPQRPSASPSAPVHGRRGATGEAMGTASVRQPAVLQSGTPEVGDAAGEHGSDVGPRSRAASSNAGDVQRTRPTDELSSSPDQGAVPVIATGRPSGDVRSETADRLGNRSEESVEPSALIPVATDHVITGLGMLARMSDTEFDAKLEMLRKGRERVATIQKTLMVEGSDYGKVPGIDRPFLHLPGAEALEKFYGLVTEQVVTRVDGTQNASGEWITPPFTYRTDCIVHLGDLSGPIVAMASGTCNVWEDRYRYRTAKQACPVCGKSGTIITRKTPEALKGKRQCANFGNKDGCGQMFEPDDPRLAPPGKEENPDPFGLDETVMQISAKRAYVAGIRRATGTSGLFSIDDDSPAVRQQSEDIPPDAPPPPPPDIQNVPMPVTSPVTGGVPTQVQYDRLKALAGEKGLKGKDIAELLNRLFGMKVELNAAAAGAAVQTLNADQLGNLLAFIEVGDMSSIGSDEAPVVDQEADPGWPPQGS